MERDLISIIVPIYNVQLYLKRSLDSIINQSYNNLEIILVDDGSTDESSKICDSYQGIDKRIVVFHKENGGLSDARNYGLNYVNGKYVVFIDSDDFIHKDYIRMLYQLLICNNADISICNYVKGNKDVFENKENGKRKIKIFESEAMLKQWHSKYKHVETMAWNKMYKTELFIKNDIRYPYGFYNEDVQTTHLLVKAANKVVISNQCLYYYYQRADSITGGWSDKKINDNLYSQKVRLKFFQQEGYAEAYERLFIKRQKYYILSYLHADNKIKKELLAVFRKDYRIAIKFQELLLYEKILFWVFDKYAWLLLMH